MEGHGLVTVILGTAEEPRLKRERNYTLRVTIVTEYANISSITEFSEEKTNIFLATHVIVNSHL